MKEGRQVCGPVSALALSRLEGLNALPSRHCETLGETTQTIRLLIKMKGCLVDLFEMNLAFVHRAAPARKPMA